MNKSTIITIVCAACFTAGHARETVKTDAANTGCASAFTDTMGDMSVQESSDYASDDNTSKSAKKTWSGNPILPDFHADPEVLYSNKTKRYYIYSTTDGHPGWGGWYFTCYSSKDLANWQYEGVTLDVKKDTKWATGNAWAPAIIEKKVDGKYKYYFYYSANTGKAKAIGVAVADNPTGPFTDLGHPFIDKRPEGQKNGQQIDVDVFADHDTGKSYLYWGNGYMAGAVLNDDMTSIDTTTIVRMTPPGGTLADYRYREAPYVFKRNGLYYFLWSVDDTGSPNYHVAYGTSKSPLGPIEVAENPVILIRTGRRDIWYCSQQRASDTGQGRVVLRLSSHKQGLPAQRQRAGLPSRSVHRQDGVQH